MTSEPPASPDPPDPPPPSASTLNLSLPLSPDRDLENQAAPCVASEPPSSAAAGATIFSFGGSSSAAQLRPILPSPDLPLGNSGATSIVPDTVPPSIPIGTKSGSFGGSSAAMSLSTSWASKVKAPPQRLTFPTLTNSGIPRVHIPTAIFKEGATRHREFVALTFLDKTPSMGKIHAYLSYIWGKNRKIEVFSNSLGTIVARIPSEESRQRILDVQLWHIDGDAFIAQEWSHKYSYSKPSLEAIPIWVRFNNVPCDLITEKGLFSIGGALGHPVAARNLHGFSSGEVQVKIDLTKPLPNLTEVETDEGDIITLEVTYLKLPPLCSHCRIIGHRDSACKTTNHAPIVRVQGNDLKMSHTTPQVASDFVSTASDSVSTSSLPLPPSSVDFASAEVQETVAGSLNPTPLVISDIVSPDTTIPKTATVSETLQTPSNSPKEITTIAEVIQGVVKAVREQNSYAKVVATPARTSSPSPSSTPAKLVATPADKVITPPMSANEVVTPPLSSPLSDNPHPCDDISSPSLVKPATTSTFGNLFDKNGVFIGDDWNVSTQKSRGGRRLKPSQKKQDMQWMQSRGSRGSRGRGGHPSK